MLLDLEIGSGVDQFTGKRKLVAALPTQVVPASTPLQVTAAVSNVPVAGTSTGTNSNATPAASTTHVSIPATEATTLVRVYTSAIDVKRDFALSSEANIGVPAYNITSGLNLSYEHIEEATENDVFAAYKYIANDSIVAPGLTTKYVLIQEAEDFLLTATPKEFVDRYGTAVVDTITSGRRATIIVQIHANTNSEQKSIEKKLQSAAGQIFNGNVDIKNTLSSLIGETRTTIHIYSAGIDHPSAGIPSSVADASTLFSSVTLSKQTAQAVQLSYTTKRFSDLASLDAAREKAKKIEELLSIAQILYGIIDKTALAITECLQILRADTKRFQRNNGYLTNKKNHRDSLIVKFKSIQSTFAGLAEYIRTNCCDSKALKDATYQVEYLVQKIIKLKARLTRLAEVELPIARIPSREIRDIYHSQGEDEYDLSSIFDARKRVFRIKAKEEERNLAIHEGLRLASEAIKSATQAVGAVKDSITHPEHAGLKHAELSFRRKVAAIKAEKIEAAQIAIIQLDKTWQPRMPLDKRKIDTGMTAGKKASAVAQAANHFADLLRETYQKGLDTNYEQAAKELETLLLLENVEVPVAAIPYGKNAQIQLLTMLSVTLTLNGNNVEIQLPIMLYAILTLVGQINVTAIDNNDHNGIKQALNEVKNVVYLAIGAIRYAGELAQPLGNIDASNITPEQKKAFSQATSASIACQTALDKLQATLLALQKLENGLKSQALEIPEWLTRAITTTTNIQNHMRILARSQNNAMQKAANSIINAVLQRALFYLTDRYDPNAALRKYNIASSRASIKPFLSPSDPVEDEEGNIQPAKANIKERPVVRLKVNTYLPKLTKGQIDSKRKPHKVKGNITDGTTMTTTERHSRHSYLKPQRSLFGFGKCYQGIFAVGVFDLVPLRHPNALLPSQEEIDQVKANGFAKR